LLFSWTFRYLLTSDKNIAKTVLQLYILKMISNLVQPAI